MYKTSVYTLVNGNITYVRVTKIDKYNKFMMAAAAILNSVYRS